MNPIVFDGNQRALAKEQALLPRVAALKNQGKKLKIAAVLFKEDQGSVLYTRLKQEAATRVGIGYEVHEFSMRDEADSVIARIAELNTDPTVTGIIIQKPWRRSWEEVTGRVGVELAGSPFGQWWHHLVLSLDSTKDVDGLHPLTLEAIKLGTWQKEGRVLPATCQAVVEILGIAFGGQISSSARIAVIGKSDILGLPLYYYLKNVGVNVEMFGSKELNRLIEEKKYLFDFDVVVTATGRHHLITGDLVKDGVIVVDVGEPKPDVEFASVAPKAAFMTPVPGGVGPMTVICLLENCVTLAG